MAWKVRSGRALANFDSPPEMAYTGRIRPSWMAAAVFGREILPPEAAPGKSDLALPAMEAWRTVSLTRGGERLGTGARLTRRVASSAACRRTRRTRLPE